MVFKHKFHADGTLNRYKARLVANGSSQQLGVDLDETFSPVVKPATIRTVLSLAVSRKCLIHQLDIKNSFLNSDLLDCYNDVDLAGCPSIRRSTSDEKHIEIDIHFICDMVTAGQVRVLHVPSRYQLADVFTKGLPSALFEEFRSILSVHLPLAPTARTY
ncbi:ribonuclease H-like domain-containing protein [Tanacetum coccineum]|uniref:Ribonuclease H-like domain-containing protein n=1 Tax=Tanacetum coccineum TaxID=301880 RepID=A0ABQ5F8H1_9ASTR